MCAHFLYAVIILNIILYSTIRGETCARHLICCHLTENKWSKHASAAAKEAATAGLKFGQFFFQRFDEAQMQNEREGEGNGENNCFYCVAKW